MKKITLILVAVVVAGLLTLAMASCAGGGEETMTEKEIQELPDWVMNMEMAEDAMYGIGYAKMSNLNTSRTTALARARTDLSFQIRATIQAMMTDYQQEAGVDDNTQVINFVENISKQLTNNVLTGLTPDKMAVMKDGGVWVRVVYNKNKFIEDSQEAFQRNEDAAFAEFKADQASQRLEAQLEDNPPQSEPVTK